jgi:hypothetical protein
MKFRAIFSNTQTGEIEFEANSRNEAWEKAKAMEREADFPEVLSDIESMVGWEIGDVDEIIE